MFLKSILIHSLRLLNYVYIVVFDVVEALEKDTLVILERLELQNFPLPTIVEAEESFCMKLFQHFTRTKI